MTDEARQVSMRLGRWLLSDAYPVWSQRGWDPKHGGFHERLTADGPVAGDARRVRVQLRQIYSFARAPRLGWGGDAHRLVNEGLAHFFARYRRPDGLARALVAPDGSVADDRAMLYDQAFVLLALAEAYRLLGAGHGLWEAAGVVLGRIQTAYKRAGRGFRADGASEYPLSSNPHMHLLEAALAWCPLAPDPRWRRLADELVDLALDCMMDARTGVLREHFELPDTGSQPLGARIVEPGHQFEWAWLLLCAGGAKQRSAAIRLIEIGEAHGVRDGVAINCLLDDMTAHDPRARLWPQTERLKAHALMARLTGEPRHWRLAAQAGRALEQYLDPGARGLWHDQRLPDGSFVREPAPASSFYHIVCAIGELAAALETVCR